MSRAKQFPPRSIGCSFCWFGGWCLWEGFDVLVHEPSWRTFQDGGSPIYWLGDVSPALVFGWAEADTEIKLEVAALALVLAVVPGTAEMLLVTVARTAQLLGIANRKALWLTQISQSASSLL